MTRQRLAMHIRDRLKEKNIDLSVDTIKEIIAIEEDEVYMAIAVNDFVQYSWGKIYGIEKPPIKVAGRFRLNDAVRENHGWSAWRTSGVPKVEWSKAAKIAEKEPAEKYFELPPQRYCSKAREFRKDAGLPEIPEFKDLSEEKIKEICAKTDQAMLDALPPKVRRNKIKDDKSNGLKKRGMLLLWEQNPDIVPMHPTNPDYHGPTRDEIDSYINIHINVDGISLPMKLDEVRNAIDFAETIGLISSHMDLYDMEKDLVKKVKESGLDEIIHIKKEYQGSATAKYKGSDVVSARESLEENRLRVEKAQREVNRITKKLKQGKVNEV